MTEIILDTRESHIIHIEGLQATLTKRNARIAELEAERDAMKQGDLGSPHITRAIEAAHRRGWQECANFLNDSTKELVLKLGKIRKNALDAYYEPERLDHIARQESQTAEEAS